MIYAGKLIHAECEIGSVSQPTRAQRKTVPVSSWSARPHLGGNSRRAKSESWAPRVEVRAEAVRLVRGRCLSQPFCLSTVVFDTCRGSSVSNLRRGGCHDGQINGPRRHAVHTLESGIGKVGSGSVLCSRIAGPSGVRVSLGEHRGMLARFVSVLFSECGSQTCFGEWLLFDRAAKYVGDQRPALMIYGATNRSGGHMLASISR